MIAVLLRRLATVVASAALISCLGGGGAGDDPAGGTGSGGLCQAITGGNSRISTGQSDTCLGCATEHPERAADGDLDSFASLTAPTTFAGEGLTIRATAQPGIVFPGGQQVAVFFVPPATSGFNSPDQSVTLATYLGGELQESPTSLVSRTADETGTAFHQRSFATTKAFDAVEVMVSNTQGAAMPFEIHEICSDSTVE